MTDESPDTGKRGQGIVLRGIVLKYCSCGHPIGVETPSEPCRFYDSGDWNRPVETCPSCHRLIEEAGLDFSEEQRARLGQVYDFLLGLAHKADRPVE
jgi:hypothetical protein